MLCAMQKRNLDANCIQAQPGLMPQHGLGICDPRVQLSKLVPVE